MGLNSGTVSSYAGVEVEKIKDEGLHGAQHKIIVEMVADHMKAVGHFPEVVQAALELLVAQVHHRILGKGK